ncbi:MAG: hypothetical protein ACKO5E_23060 [bacterium]
MQSPELTRRNSIVLPMLLALGNLSAADDSGRDASHLIQILSDKPSGPASADNLMTNEDSIASVVDELDGKVPTGQVYLGVGPDQNFTLMAYARPAMSFIIDYRRKNQLLHFLHQALLQLSESRMEYLENFWARRFSGQQNHQKPLSAEAIMAGFEKAELDQKKLREVQEKVKAVIRLLHDFSPDDLNEIAKIQARLAGPGPETRFLALKMYPTIRQMITGPSRSGKPGHWLASDESYATVRQLSSSGHIYPITGDWSANSRGNETVFSKLGAYLRREKRQVGCYYISDVEFFLFRSGRFSDYLANLGQLPWHPSAVVIRTSTREISHRERVAGQSSTTVCRPVQAFLEACHLGKINRWEDLWQPD